MANKTAEPLALRTGDRTELERLTRSATVPAGLAQRARIVLLAADGLANVEIAARVGVSRPTVISWRARYARAGSAGWPMQPGRVVRGRWTGRKIVAATLTPPPKKLGVTHWSSRLLAPHLGIGDATVAAGVAGVRGQAVAVETFKFSTDPRAGRQGHRRRRAVSGRRRRTRSCCAWTRSPVRHEALMKPCGMGGPPPVIAVTGRSWRQIDPRVRGEVGSSLDNVGAGRNYQTARAR